MSVEGENAPVSELARVEASEKRKKALRRGAVVLLLTGLFTLLSALITRSADGSYDAESLRRALEYLSRAGGALTTLDGGGVNATR